jgi:hypothetical protein
MPERDAKDAPSGAPAFSPSPAAAGEGAGGWGFLAAKIAPQRSTQYAALASALAIPELRLSPLGSSIQALRPLTLGGQPYVVVELTGPLTPVQERTLWQMGATSEFFWLHESVGGVAGPFLQPIEPYGTPLLPPELVEARRYRGKTNELFSRVLINLALWAHPGTPSVLLDPLMGGGTFLFIGLLLGLDVIGIEMQRTDVETTDTFLGQFLRDARVRHQRKAERVSGARRTTYAIEPKGPNHPLRAVLVHGDATEASKLLANLPRARPDLIVADLPYGIQHEGRLQPLLAAALPAWHRVAAADAVLALAWDATRTPRATMAGWVEEGGQWQALRGGAWEDLAHPVDRVIKRRDVMLARRIALSHPSA